MAAGIVAAGALAVLAPSADAADTAGRLQVTDVRAPRAGNADFGDLVVMDDYGENVAFRQTNTGHDPSAPAVIASFAVPGYRYDQGLAPGAVVHGMAMSGDGDTLALVREDRATARMHVDLYGGASEIPNWTLFRSFDLPDGGRGARTVAVSDDGATVLISAPHQWWVPGEATVLHRTENGWSQERLLPPHADAPPRRLGGSIALSGDGQTAVLAAPDTVDYAIGSPSDEVYRRTERGWVRVGTLGRYGPPGSADDTLTVSDDGATIAVINPAAHAPLADIYVRTPNGGYTATARFRPAYSESTAYGSSIALSGDGTTLLVGAADRSRPGLARAGAVYRYVRSGQGWKWGGLLDLGNAVAGDHLGAAVAVDRDGGTVIASAPGRLHAEPTSAADTAGVVVEYQG